MEQHRDSEHKGKEGQRVGREMLLAHQVKSPMAAMMSSLEALLGGYAGSLTPKQRRLLEGMRRKARVIARLTQEMLQFESLTSPTLEHDFRAFDLRRLCEAVYQAHRERASARGVELHLDLADRPLGVRGSEEVLREVLGEFLTNAIKYTPRHGRVRLSAVLSPAGDSVIVTVSDTGIGIPPEAQAHIFEEFYRAPNARRLEPDGTGMGLAMVRRAVQRHAGAVAFHSREGEGSEFTLTLPYVALKEEAAEATGRRVVIIGGVAAGPKIAAKVARLDPGARITIIERGTFLAYVGCGLPEYVSGRVRDQRELMSTAAGVLRDPVFFHMEKNIAVLNRSEAVNIDRQHKEVVVLDRVSHEQRRIPYDVLALCTGGRADDSAVAGPRPAGVLTLHGVEDAEALRRLLATGEARDAVIVGGGLLGCTIAEALRERGMRITMVEMRPQILAILDGDLARLVARHLESRGVRVIVGEKVTGFVGDDRLREVITEKRRIPAEVAILAVGVRPEVTLAQRAGLVLGPTGAIQVDERLRTSDPNIYAAGDCAEKRHIVTGRPCYIPRGSTANKEGRVAAINICGGEAIFPGVLGTTALKVFEFNVARTGLNEREAREAGYNVETCIAPGPDRAHYLPTARRLILKLVADRANRRLLGAQGIGPGDVAKRIDVAATAISAGMTVDQVANLDLAYAPHYSEAMDNIITAANVLRNKLDGFFVGISADALKARMEAREELLLLDVRTPAEHDEIALPNSRLVPYGLLRTRLDSLPRDKEIVVYCDIGLRAYEAALFLHHAGFRNVKVLEGGIECWPFETT